jgi:hypothetical protein
LGDLVETQVSVPMKYYNDVRQFTSWYEFLEYVKQDARLNPLVSSNYLAANEMASRRDRNQGYQWYGTQSFEEAYNLALNGWIDGQEKAYTLSKPLIEKLLSRIERPDIYYDVEGISIDMGRVASEDPECWMQFSNEIVETSSYHRLIRIVVNNTVSAGIAKERITAKGAAIATVVELLEFAGNRVELVALPYCIAGVSSGNWHAEKADTFCSVVVKPFDQPLEMSRVMFAIAHPSMLRRFGFSFAELTSRECQLDIQTGYGCVAELNAEQQKYYNLTSDLYFGGSVTGEPAWTDEKETLDWIIRTLSDQGVKITKEEHEILQQ